MSPKPEVGSVDLDTDTKRRRHLGADGADNAENEFGTVFCRTAELVLSFVARCSHELGKEEAVANFQLLLERRGARGWQTLGFLRPT